MKTTTVFTKTKILTVALLGCAVLFIQGCASTPRAQQIRQEIAATGVLISAAGMQAYVTVASDRCKGDTNCLAKVNHHYAIYTNAVNAFMAGYSAYEQYGTNRPALLNLLSAITAAQADITRAVLEINR